MVICVKSCDQDCAGWNPRTSAPALVETIVGEWRLFTGNKPPEDDVSVAVILKR